tara:strand:+ start:417 stop:809 length:393 start_codon:yes stop_codon:yes gene_type:complete
MKDSQRKAMFAKKKKNGVKKNYYMFNPIKESEEKRKYGVNVFADKVYGWDYSSNEKLLDKVEKGISGDQQNDLADVLDIKGSMSMDKLQYKIESRLARKTNNLSIEQINNISFILGLTELNDYGDLLVKE